MNKAILVGIVGGMICIGSQVSAGDLDKRISDAYAKRDSVELTNIFQEYARGQDFTPLDDSLEVVSEVLAQYVADKHPGKPFVFLPYEATVMLGDRKINEFHPRLDIDSDVIYFGGEIQKEVEAFLGDPKSKDAELKRRFIGLTGCTPYHYAVQEEHWGMINYPYLLGIWMEQNLKETTCQDNHGGWGHSQVYMVRDSTGTWKEIKGNHHTWIN